MSRPPISSLASLALAAALGACATGNPAVDAGAARVGEAAKDGADKIGQGARLAAKQGAVASGAAYDAAKRAASPPAFTPMTANAQLMAQMQPTGLPMASQWEGERAGPNSLWRTNARSFFNDQRAGRVGDILTVNINIDDSAEVKNDSSRNRTSSTTVGVPNLFGQESNLGRYVPGSFDPSALVSAAGNSTASGSGSMRREEKVELTIAAVVTEVLPNGNLVISGRQEVRINAEVRDLTIAGVIRPEDIGADNTISHTQIAEARIEYGGRGQITAVQRPRWLQRVTDAVSPW
jgi:flagellar L-ring protein precursor FlgH